MQHQLAIISVVATCALAAGSASAQQANPSQPTTQPSAKTVRVMSIADLQARPLLWPKETTLVGGIQVTNGPTLQPGTAVRVDAIEDGKVIVALPGDIFVALRPEQTTILQDAAAGAEQVSPEMQALTYESLVKRRVLWPLKVALNVETVLDDGTTFKPGSELTLDDLTADRATLLTPDGSTVFAVRVNSTDVLERARERLEMSDALPAGKLLEELTGKLIDRNGNPVELGKDVEYVGIYFAAGWCPPCRSFTPQLVDFYENARERSDNFAIVYVPYDKSADDMLAYLRKAKVPFPAVRFDKSDDLPIAARTKGGATPQLVIMDREGRVIQDTIVDGKYIGPVEAARKLQQLALTN